MRGLIFLIWDDHIGCVPKIMFPANFQSPISHHELVSLFTASTLGSWNYARKSILTSSIIRERESIIKTVIYFGGWDAKYCLILFLDLFEQESSYSTIVENLFFKIINECFNFQGDIEDKLRSIIELEVGNMDRQLSENNVKISNLESRIEHIERKLDQQGIMLEKILNTLSDDHDKKSY